MTDSARHRSSTIRPARLAIPHQSQTPTTPTPTLHTARIRAHLAHLLPRHAAFSLTLTVHQLNNVPLVHGEFGLKWKIKGVTSNSGTGILDKVKGRKAKTDLYPRSASATGPPSSIAKGSDTDNASLFDAASASDAHSIANSSSNDHANSAAASAYGHSTRTQPIPIPAVVVSANHPSPSPTPAPMARSISGTSSIASVDSVSSSPSNARFVHHHPGYLSTDRSRQAQAQSATPTHDSESSPFGDTLTKYPYSPAKGITPFVKLKDHSVVWEQTLKFVVEMSVGRDSHELGDCLVRFIVMQRVIPGDPDAPRNPRLGAVYLNLAQYVNAGIVTRRHLLRQSKTNATLKLTVHLEHTAGELDYVAPPLPRDEILSGVAGILESSDIYRTRPRASDLYTRGPSDSSSDAGTASGSDASSVISGSTASHGGPGQSNGHGRAMAVKKQRRPFEVSKLPTIDDPRGTEKLIEALFNPVPVTQPSRLSPFTYLVEVDEDGDGDGNGDGDADGGGDRAHGWSRADRAAGTRSEQSGAGRGVHEVDDDGSLYADSQDESGDEKVDGARSDYHSLRSHPSVQGSMRSKRSTLSLAGKVGLKHDEGDEATTPVCTTGVQTQGGTTERRTWWQKVLSSPSPSG